MRLPPTSFNFYNAYSSKASHQRYQHPLHFGSAGTSGGPGESGGKLIVPFLVGLLSLGVTAANKATREFSPMAGVAGFAVGTLLSGGGDSNSGPGRRVQQPDTIRVRIDR